MKAKIYSKKGCGACVTAKLFMENKGIEFEEIEVDKDPDALKYVISQGVRGLPLIEFGETKIVGFSPAEILTASMK